MQNRKSLSDSGETEYLLGEDQKENLNKYKEQLDVLRKFAAVEAVRSGINFNDCINQLKEFILGLCGDLKSPPSELMFMKTALILPSTEVTISGDSTLSVMIPSASELMGIDNLLAITDLELQQQFLDRDQTFPQFLQSVLQQQYKAYRSLKDGTKSTADYEELDKKLVSLIEQVQASAHDKKPLSPALVSQSLNIYQDKLNDVIDKLQALDPDSFAGDLSSYKVLLDYVAESINTSKNTAPIDKPALARLILDAGLDVARRIADKLQEGYDVFRSSAGLEAWREARSLLDKYSTAVAESKFTQQIPLNQDFINPAKKYKNS